MKRKTFLFLIPQEKKEEEKKNQVIWGRDFIYNRNVNTLLPPKSQRYLWTKGEESREIFNSFVLRRAYVLTHQFVF